MGGGIHGDVAGQTGVIQGSHLLAQGGSIQTDLLDGLLAGHDDVVTQEVLVGRADLVGDLLDHGSGGLIFRIDVVDEVDVGAVAAIGGVEGGSGVQTVDNLARVAKLSGGGADGDQLLGVVGAVDGVDTGGNDGLQQGLVVGIGSTVGHDQGGVNGDAALGQGVQEGIQQRDGVGVLLIVQDAEGLEAVLQSEGGHDLTLGQSAGLQAEHVRIGGAVGLQLAGGIHGQADNGNVVAFGGFLDGVCDVGNGRSDDQRDLIDGDGGDVGVDGFGNVALGVVGLHDQRLAADTAVGVDLVNSSLSAGLNGFAQSGGVAGDVLQAADQDLTLGGVGLGVARRSGSVTGGSGGGGAGIAAGNQTQSHDQSQGQCE